MKLIAVFVTISVFLITSSALAQEYYTLAELRSQATEGWKETYIDKYDRTVNVDIEVQVFGEENAPVLKIGFPEYVRYIEDQNPPYDTVSDIRRGRIATHIFRAHGESVDLDKAYGEDYGNDLTLREVYDFIIPLLEQQGVYAEDFIFDPPAELDVMCSFDQKTRSLVATAFYNLHMWPRMHGLPILEHATFSFSKQGWVGTYTPRIVFQMRNQEEYSLFIGTLVEQEMIVEDIPLCTLKQVIQNLESEIEAGYIQKVVSLRFGYALYNDPTIASGQSKRISAYDVPCFYAVPSWVLECVFAENPKDNIVDKINTQVLNDPEFDEYGAIKTIVINAQTGKMLDPFDTSKNGAGDADYKGFISWEDVK